MTYSIIIAFGITLMTGFASGYALDHKLSQAKILNLELALQKGNAAAAEMLAQAKAKVATAEKKALLANQELDNAHASAINSINTIRDQHAAERLFDHGRKARCPDPLPGSADTGQHQSDATDRAELSAQLASFLWAESYRADQTAVDKNVLLAYVKSNCGMVISTKLSKK